MLYYKKKSYISEGGDMRYYSLLDLLQMNSLMRKRNTRALPMRWTKPSPSCPASKAVPIFLSFVYLRVLLCVSATAL